MLTHAHTCGAAARRVRLQQPSASRDAQAERSAPTWTRTTDKQKAKESQSRPVPRRQKIPMQLWGCLTPQIARPKSHLVPHGCLWEACTAAVRFSRHNTSSTEQTPPRPPRLRKLTSPEEGVKGAAPGTQCPAPEAERAGSPAQRGLRGWAQAGFLSVPPLFRFGGDGPAFKLSTLGRIYIALFSLKEGNLSFSQ